MENRLSQIAFESCIAIYFTRYYRFDFAVLIPEVLLDREEG